jgi:EamA domain-containing membrane protein RarD
MTVSRFYYLIAWALGACGVILNLTNDVERSQLAFLIAILFALFAIYRDNVEVQ